MKPEVYVSLILSFNNSGAFHFPKKIIFHRLLSSFLLPHTKHYAACLAQSCAALLSLLVHIHWLATKMPPLRVGNGLNPSRVSLQNIHYGFYLAISCHLSRMVYFILLLPVFPKLMNGFHTYWVWKVWAVGRKLKGKWQTEQTTWFDKLIYSGSWAKYVSQYKIMFLLPNEDPFLRTQALKESRFLYCILKTFFRS